MVYVINNRSTKYQQSSKSKLNVLYDQQSSTKKYGLLMVCWLVKVLEYNKLNLNINKLTKYFIL